MGTASTTWCSISGRAWALWAWMNHGSWLFLNAQSPTHLVTGDLDNNGRDEVVLDFPGAGLWVWRNNTSWAQLHSYQRRAPGCREPRWHSRRRN